MLIPPRCVANSKRLPIRLISVIAIVAFSTYVLGESSDALKPTKSVLEAQAARIQAIAKATQSTIGVFGTDGQGGGSGVIVSADGYALTNFHVTQPFGDRMRCGLSNGEMVEAVIVGIDPTGDLALIKLYGRDDFPAATLADSNTVQAGQWCFAAGNPFVLATNLMPTVTWGIVSGVHRYQYPSGTILEYTDCIQTDAAINPGNSGGPLYNSDGDLIGINGRCSFEKRGRVNVGVGYAISINQAKLFLGHLKSGRVVDHATLGFTVGSDSGRVVVSNILESSDAYRRGLRYGDEILRLDDREITTVNQLKNILGIFPSHSRLRLQFRQEDRIHETWVRVSPLHSAAELDEIASGKSMESKPAENPEPKPKLENDPLAARFETRRGFANYYFNRFELDRILTLGGGPTKEFELADGWQWTGKVRGEQTNLSIVLKKGGIESKFGDQSIIIDATRGWGELVSSKSLHCAALGARLWQQWKSIGPRNMGEATYLGTCRIIGVESMVDFTKVTSGEVEAFFFTSPDDGRIQLIEIESDRQLDRLEIYFDDYQSQEALQVPKTLRVAFGPETRMTIDLGALPLPKPVGGDL
ncbi:MAG: trypsin-like peptidase domain-containing protein [Pirellulaceae bacterium]|nr:trypsin-like peptidase domain-containing protein [Pirellulaceae bacterium]